jgi:hypothetical protein
VGAVDIDIVTREIVQNHPNPFFEHGPEGSYFADGVSIGCCYEIAGARYMLFMGWQTPPGEHWRGDIGRLLVTQDLKLKLWDKEPLLGSDDTDKVSLSYPWVMPRKKSGFNMWYGSTRTWDAGNGEMLHVLNFAHSHDGESWRREGLAVPFIIGRAQAFSRPTVVSNTHGGLEMWFSYRGGHGEKYRIGYARSEDSKEWILDIESAGISVSEFGWDSEMIEYPFVFDHKGDRYMIYNGNDYGKTGFGLAILD